LVREIPGQREEIIPPTSTDTPSSKSASAEREWWSNAGFKDSTRESTKVEDTPTEVAKNSLNMTSEVGWTCDFVAKIWRTFLNVIN